jgi:hypothetical protein
MKDKKKWVAFEAILKWLHDSEGHLVKEISKALNTASRKLQYSMPTKNSGGSERDKSKGHRDKRNVYSTDVNLFFGMSMVVIIFMLLFASVGVVSALTITEDYTVLENQIINEDLTLDGASHCTIRNNIIHGRLFISNFSEYTTISDNTVDELIYLHESAYNTLTGNHMGGFFIGSIGSGTSPKYRYDQDIDTSNLVKGKPLYYYFDIHDTVIEGLTNIGQLYIAVSSHVTIRGLNMDTAGIYLKGSHYCVITDCIVDFTADSNIHKIGSMGIILDNCDRATVKNSTVTISGANPSAWGIFGDTIPNGIFSNNTISVSGTGYDMRGFNIYCSFNVKITDCTITAPDAAVGAVTYTYAYDTVFEIVSSYISHVYMSEDQGQPNPDIKTLLIDTTYDRITVDESWVAHRLWYLDAKVIDSAGDPVELATVTATDKNGILAFSAITDENGNIPQQILLEYIQTETETTYSTPYTITATKSGQIDSKSIDLTESTILSFNLGEVPPDIIPPAAVTDLATRKPTSDSITLTWTAPGSDGDIGTASQYDIRYSTSAITEANWGETTQCTGEPIPQVAGSAETFTVTGLDQNTAYYFALKAADDIPNWADISNSPTETTAEIIGGLVGHWKFNEGEGTTAYDSTGEGNDGTIYGASWATGILGSALAFDGSNDYVDCGNAACLDISGEKTISIWLKISEWTSHKAPWSKYLDGTHRVLFQTWPDQTIQFWIVDTTPQVQIPTDIINIDEWTLVVVTIDEANQVAKIYQNGVYINQDTSFTLPDISAADFIIGSSGADGRYFNGAIDDVRIYNYALSDAEVLALYQGEAPPDTIPPAAVTDLAASKPTSDSITLTWTAPGGDGVIGTASQYDIRYSTTGISEANWNVATQCTGEPTPQVAGSAETFTVTGLAQNTPYYFALKAADDIPNWADVSNSPTETTTELVGRLVGHWKFDEGEGTTAYDSSGEGNDGTVYGASWTTGVLGSALAFDGYNDYVDCGNDNSLDISGDKTISIWLRRLQ